MSHENDAAVLPATSRHHQLMRLLARVPASHVRDAFAAEQSTALSRRQARTQLPAIDASKPDNPRIQIAACFLMPAQHRFSASTTTSNAHLRLLKVKSNHSV